MTHRHQPAATTHTVELDQVLVIESRLGTHAPVTAAALGLDGLPAIPPSAFSIPLFETRTPSAGTLGPRAVLRHVKAQGSPEYPYVLGQFEDPVNGGARVVELHSQALHRLCVAMGLSQCWGTDAVLTGSSIR
ncbi:hypothetical protein [Kineosporia succinea]|uniref:Uncharacterized protein n=1 Tax=Kineosporia succinea TaxID=84632 RepID=A0ABT9P8W6_9ACTN|nr:hypothetical protein [Kineosporia succinea]MDP9828991.1 hypothetical protein [Kineosporia succinea]